MILQIFVLFLQVIFKSSLSNVCQNFTKFIVSFFLIWYAVIPFCQKCVCGVPYITIIISNATTSSLSLPKP